MEIIIIGLGLALLLGVILGPVFLFAQSARLNSLVEEVRRLKLQLDKKSSAESKQTSQLIERIQKLEQDARLRGVVSGENPSSPLETPTIAPRSASVESAPNRVPVSIIEPLADRVEGTILPDELEDSPWLEATPLTPGLVKSHRELADLQSQHKPEGDHTVQRIRDRLTHRSATLQRSKEPAASSQGGVKSRDFNELVASQWMSWVGAVAVMVGVGFGLKYAIEEQYLGPTGRVALGLLTGALTFVMAVLAIRKDYRVLAEGLAGAAMGTLYFSLFAAFQWYDLLPQLVAFSGMIMVTAAGLGFAGQFKSLPSAILAMIGGFLTPFMLSKGGGSISALFTYVLILDLGVLALATFRSWGKLHLLNFFGTVVIWLGWLANRSPAEELWLTVSWITLFAVVFSLLGLWRHVVRKEISSTPDTALMLLTPLVYFAALYGLTQAGYSAYHGVMALGVAAYYLELGLFAYLRNPGNNPVVVTLVGIGLSFVTLAVPLQLTGHWIVIAWALESLLLIELGLRYEKPGFRLTGFGLLVIVQLHMVLYAGGTLTGPQRFTTDFVRRQWETPVSVSPELSAWGGVINGRSMSYLANALVLAILAWEYRRREKTARVEVPEELASKIGLRGPLPDAGQVSMVLIPLVPVMIMGMGLLETFVYGVHMHWSLATHLSMLPVWLSLFAGASIACFKRMNDVSTLAALAKCLYGITAILFLLFFALRFPDWGASSEPLWGTTLFNPRGIGFFAAFTSVLVGAIQFSRSSADEVENLSIGTSLTLAVPMVLLAMCLTETYAYGQRHQWLWATQLSQGGFWVALFSAGTILAARWLRPITKLEMLSRLMYLVSAGLMLLLALSTVVDAAAGGGTLQNEAWSRFVINPRGLCLLTGAGSLVVGLLASSRAENRLDRLFATGLAVAIPVTLLALCEVETFAMGLREQWQWASMQSGAGIWLALFSAGVLLGSRRWAAFSNPLRCLSQSLVVGVCGVLAVLFLWTLATWGAAKQHEISSIWSIPLANPRGCCFLLSIGAVCLHWKLSRPSTPEYDTDTSPVKISSTTLGLLTYGIAFLMFTIEVFAQGKQRGWGTATSLAITGTWSLIAVLTIGAGLLKRSTAVRIVALAVFALTTAKVFLYDVWYLDKPIRIAAFVGLGVALMLTSFLYQRFRERLKDWIKPICLLLATTMACHTASSARAESAPDLSTRFTHRFEILTENPTAPSNGIESKSELVGLKLSPEIYAASQRELADMRILSLDESGASTQIPFVLISPTDKSRQSTVTLPVLKHVDEAQLSTWIIDARSAQEPIDTMGFQLGVGSRDTVRRVQLYGSQDLDSNDWKLLVNDGYFLDSERDGTRVTQASIRCPSPLFRYYRLVIDNKSEAPLDITSCQANLVRQHVAARETYSLKVNNEVRGDRHMTRAELSLAGPVPVERLELQIAGPDDYHRNGRLYEIHATSTTPLASISLVHRAAVHPDTTVSIMFNPTRSSRYRLEIDNGDDRPLHVLSGRAFGITQWLAVPLNALRDARHPLALYVGGDVDAPSYDLAKTHTVPDLETLSTMQFSNGMANPAYREPASPLPWAERHKTLVWMIVIAGMTVLSALGVWLLNLSMPDETDSPQPPREEPVSNV